MDRRFLTLFALTTTLIALAAAAASSTASGGGLLTGAVATVLGLAALLGLIALVRNVYLDGRASAARREGRRS